MAGTGPTECRGLRALRRGLAAALLALAVLGSAPPASALVERFVVGVEDSRYLPHYALVDGHYRGFARDLLDAFFDALGATPDYRPMPVARLFRSFMSGEVDLKYPDNALWQAAQKAGRAIDYSDPVVGYTDGVSVPPERVGAGIGAIRVLGTLRGFSPGGWAARLAAGQVKLMENDSFRGLVEQAIIGRVDGAYANVDVVRHLLASELGRPDALRFDPALPHVSSAYHLSTIAHPEIIEAFDAWMRDETALVGRLKTDYGLD